VIEIFH